MAGVKKFQRVAQKLPEVERVRSENSAGLGSGGVLLRGVSSNRISSSKLTVMGDGFCLQFHTTC